MSFIVVPIEDVGRVRKALALLEGLPRRGAVYRNGQPDQALTDEIIPLAYAVGAPGWLVEAIGEGDTDGALTALELSTALEQHLGKTVEVDSAPFTLPHPLDLLETEQDLPPSIQAVRASRRAGPSPLLL